MARHSNRASSGRYAPRDPDDDGPHVPDMPTVPDDPHSDHQRPVYARVTGRVPIEPAYSAPERPDPLAKYDFASTAHHNGRTNPYLGRGDRATYRDSAGIPVDKPKQGINSYFLSPAMNAKITRAEKDARIVANEPNDA